MRRNLLPVLIGTVLGLTLLGLFNRLLKPDNPAVPQSGDRLLTTKAVAEEVAGELNLHRANSITNAVTMVEGAIVGINVIQLQRYVSRSPFSRDPFFRNFFPDRVIERPVENLGSGFLISPDGYLITNEHVIHNATQVVVTLPDSREYVAELKGADFAADVALLKIDAEDLPYIRFGDSDQLLMGEWVIALGNPYGLFAVNDKPAVTVGVVSAVERDFGKQRNQRIYKDMIQTDAAINPGNSGGPLVNALGELVGMNTMIYSESGGSIGIGFAIPANRLRRVVEDLRRYGEVQRNYWTGIYVQDMNRLIALSLDYSGVGGAIITEIDPGSPGEEAGLEVSDIITGINDKTVQSSREIEQYLLSEDLRVGDEMEFTVYRNGKTHRHTVILEKRN
ncbi:MAG: trypsin-like peptidase domain-containing protein [Candidatus Delongbacteria bacterium]|nr:trypsin-like peptidase domain-containing protein [Candidatus Delongbacteria bacterium]